MAAPLSPAPGHHLLADAERAVAMATADPEQAAQLARQVEAAATRARQPEARAVALRALGTVARDAGDVESAIAHLKASAAVARRHCLRAREGEARTSLVFVLLSSGQTAAALREADRAAPLLDRLEAARLGAQRALAAQRLGHAAAAEAGLREALASFRRLRSPLDEARAAGNLGVILAYRGDLTGGERMLQRALQLFDQLELAVPATDASHNLGWVAARRGDIPTALARYDDAQQRAAALGLERSMYLLDRCEALLAVRVTEEALALAEQAATALAAAGMKAEHAEARLLSAQAALLSGQPALAQERAVEARRAFTRQQRRSWATLASYVELQARVAGAADGRTGRRRGPSAAQAWSLARELEALGWLAPAADVRMTGAAMALGSAAGGTVAVRGERAQRARSELEAVSAARHGGPVDVRVRGWHAEAVLRRLAGDRAGAERATRRGLDLLADHQAVLGATELRVHAAATAGELVALGTGIAIERGSAPALLGWAERAKAAAGPPRRVRPARAPALARALTELRAVTGEVEAAAFDGAPPAAQAALVTRQTRLEHEVRRLSRHERAGHRGRAQVPTARHIGERLGPNRALVELVAHEASLHAVVVTSGRTVRRSLGPGGPVADELGHLGFALRQLARVGVRGGPPAGGAGSATGDGGTASGVLVAEAAAGAVHAATRLDDLVLGALAGEIGDRELVIVPTAGLLNVPWALLPSCAGRPVSIAPSAAAWLEADAVRAARAGRHAVVVAGPELEHAEREAASVAAVHDGAVHGGAVHGLAPDEASAAAVLAAADRAWLLHLAAHGEFRDDNPLFSSFWLADGPLNAYDLEGLRRVPTEIVLSACESAVSGGAGGGGGGARNDAVASLGVATVLLALGARDVVASVSPVPDLEAVDLMTALHRHLVDGESMAAALANAQQETRAGGDREGGGHALLAAAAFVCFGAG